MEVAQLMILGLGNLEISNKLAIQKTTVSTYKNRIFEKLNITNVVSLVAIFQDNKSAPSLGN
jgi:DNA-binding NarL/FixJ family response regulator